MFHNTKHVSRVTYNIKGNTMLIYALLAWTNHLLLTQNKIYFLLREYIYQLTLSKRLQWSNFLTLLTSLMLLMRFLIKKQIKKRYKHSQVYYIMHHTILHKIYYLRPSNMYHTLRTYFNFIIWTYWYLTHDKHVQS